MQKECHSSILPSVGLDAAGPWFLKTLSFLDSPAVELTLSRLFSEDSSRAVCLHVSHLMGAFGPVLKPSQDHSPNPVIPQFCLLSCLLP